MSGKESATQKGHPISAKDRPGRTPTKAATELSPFAKGVRSLPPPAKSAASRGKLRQHGLDQDQPIGKSVGDKGIRKVSSSRETDISGYGDHASARTSIASQPGMSNKAVRKSEGRHDADAPLFQSAAVNSRVQLPQSDWKLSSTPAKSAFVGTPEKKAVTNSRISRNSSRDDYKGVWPQSNTKGLCKQCKSNLLESVCFISNDGRVAAVRTGDSVRHLHVCDSPRCAANPNYKPFLVVTKKIIVAQRLSLPSMKDNFNAPSRLGIRSVASNTISCLHGDDFRRDCVAVPFENTRKGENGERASSHGDGESEVDQKRICEEERSQSAETEYNRRISIAAQSLDNSCELVPPESDPSSTSMEEVEDKKCDGEEKREYVNGCVPPTAHKNSASLTDSEDEKISRHEAQALEIDCCTPLSQVDGAFANSIRDSEDEQSCGASNMGFGSECSTPILSDKRNSIASSQGHPRSCREEDGDQASCCSTPMGYEAGLSVAGDSFHHHGDDELSCTDDDKDGTTMINNTSTLSTSPGRPEFPNSSVEQSSNKLQRKRSSVSRMRRNYLNMLKQQEAETVRLRKQEIQKRKQAGDWMLDCAIEELLHKLAPDGEARVKVLVEAFETLMSHSDSETQQNPVMHS